MSPSTLIFRCIVIASTALLSACAIFGGKEPKAPLASEAAGETETEQPHEFEARLHAAVRSELRSANRRPDRPSTKIIFKKPYYYKEYFASPNDENEYTLEFSERESRTAPLSADMNGDRIRFATPMHRKKEDARIDENFLRATGAKTPSHEPRNGKWRRLASLYVADKTEEIVNGEWRPIREAPSRPVLEEEEPTRWWQRLMFWR